MPQKIANACNNNKTFVKHCCNNHDKRKMKGLKISSKFWKTYVVVNSTLSVRDLERNIPQRDFDHSY